MYLFLTVAVKLLTVQRQGCMLLLPQQQLLSRKRRDSFFCTRIIDHIMIYLILRYKYKSISNHLAKFVSQILWFANSQNNIRRQKKISSLTAWQILFPKTQKPVNEQRGPLSKQRTPLNEQRAPLNEHRALLSMYKKKY